MADWVSGAISAGASVLGNLFNWFQTDRQRDYEREMQDRQWQMALEQWNRENAYNMPSAQMARLRAAGINPHLAYANGDVMNQSAASPTAPDAHPVQPYTVDPLTLAQIRKLDAETQNINTDSDLKLAYTDESKQNVLLKQQQVRNLVQEVDESAARIRNLDENTKKQEAERLNIKFEQVMRGKEWRDSHNKINAEIRRLNAGSALDERQYKEMCQTFVYRLTGLKLDNQLTEKQMEHYDALIKNLGMEYKLDQQQLVIRSPEFFTGRQVVNMHSGKQGIVGSVGSSMYDGISAFLKMIGGMLPVKL